jgi:hypothetical protein
MTTESSEVVSYVPKQLYDCLEQLKLEDYFGLGSCQTVRSQPLVQVVEGLRGEVAHLKKQISKLQQDFTGNQANQIIGMKSQSELLNQKQLAERLGVDKSVIEQHKTDGKEFAEWSRSKDPERICWEYTGANLFCRI